MIARIAGMVAVLAVIGLGLAGCASAPAELPSGVHVSVFQNRLDYASRQLEIKVINDSQSPVTINAARYESNRFATAALWNRPQTVPASGARDLRVQLNDPVCDEREPNDLVILDFTLADGTVGSSAVVPLDEIGRLDAITAEDCLGVAVSERAAISGPDRLVWQPGQRAPALLALTVVPESGPGSLTVHSARGTVLLALADKQGRPVDQLTIDLTVDSESSPVIVELFVVPTRCDVHAIAEDKRGTFFPLDVSTTTGPAGRIFIAMSDDVRAELYEFYADYCDFP